MNKVNISKYSQQTPFQHETYTSLPLPTASLMFVPPGYVAPFRVKHYALHYKHYFIALNKCALVIFCSMRPLVSSGEKPKAFFPLN